MVTGLLPVERLATVAAGLRTLLLNLRYSCPPLCEKSKSYMSRPIINGTSTNIDPDVSLVMASNGTKATSAPCASR